MRACPKCGQRIPSSERYCPYCGHMKNIPLPLDAYELGFIENFKHCVVHKYADFEGRASRSEYWHFMLVYQLIIAIILFICAAISCVTPVSGTTGVGLRFGSSFYFVHWIYHTRCSRCCSTFT